MERGGPKINMNNKTIIKISLAVIIIAGGVWFYSNKHPITSHQFKGTTIEIRDNNLAMIGDYIKLGQDSPMVSGSKVVTVFFDSNTKIVKKIIEIKSGSGFAKPEEPANQKQKTVTIAEMKADLKENNLVLTINTVDNVYNEDSFIATKIEYTILI